jgi:hypothetical protein
MLGYVAYPLLLGHCDRLPISSHPYFAGISAGVVFTLGRFTWEIGAETRAFNLSHVKHRKPRQ